MTPDYRPDYSPGMLRFFLHVRVCLAKGRTHDRDPLAKIADAAGVSIGEARAALGGRLMRAEPRLRLWRAIGVVPKVRLTDGGKQERAG